MCRFGQLDYITLQRFLGRLVRQLKQKNRHVILFLDNAPCHSGAIQEPLNFIKLVFLPKNTTSKLQTVDAGIRNLKSKYRKRLVRHLVSLLDGKSTTWTVIKSVAVLDTIRWLKASWDELNKNTIRNCFQKYCFSQVESVTEEAQEDAEFQHVNQLLTAKGTAEENLSFYDDVETHKEAVTTAQIDWCEITRARCIQDVITDLGNNQMEVDNEKSGKVIEEALVD